MHWIKLILMIEVANLEVGVVECMGFLLRACEYSDG
jgi:hypothetical protein